MAEYIKVRARYLEPLGNLDPVSAAPLADAGLTPMHAINGARHRLTPGATAVAIGIGGLGHMGVQVLKATSAARVIAVDTDEQKLELAKERGADVVMAAEEPRAASDVLNLTGGYGAEAVFDFVGSPATVELATAVIAPDGALRFVGIGGGSFQFPSDLAAPGVPWGVDVRRSYGGTRPDQRMVLDLAREGRVRSTPSCTRSMRGNLPLPTSRKDGCRGRAVLVP